MVEIRLSRYYKEIFFNYNTELVKQIKKEYSPHNQNWFCMSFSALASKVSRNGEDLKNAYHLISAELHGAWVISLDVDNPSPGILDFRGYPDKTTLYMRVAELVDHATEIYISTWNDIAEVVDAPKVKLKGETLTPELLSFLFTQKC